MLRRFHLNLCDYCHIERDELSSEACFSLAGLLAQDDSSASTFVHLLPYEYGQPEVGGRPPKFLQRILKLLHQPLPPPNDLLICPYGVTLRSIEANDAGADCGKQAAPEQSGDKGAVGGGGGGGGAGAAAAVEQSLCSVCSVCGLCVVCVWYVCGVWGL